MGFTKLDDNLDGSSIFREPDAVFKVWMLILSKTRSDGLAPISADYIVSITRKSDEEVDRCLSVLMSPDPRSRSQNDEGRRIRRVDGGFHVINYEKYRQRADSDGVREYERERKRRWREEEKGTHSLSEAEAEGPGLSGTGPGHDWQGIFSITPSKPRLTAHEKGARDLVLIWNALFATRYRVDGATFEQLVSDMVTRCNGGRARGATWAPCSVPDVLCAAFIADATGREFWRTQAPSVLLRTGAHARTSGSGATTGGTDHVLALLTKPQAVQVRISTSALQLATIEGLVDHLVSRGVVIPGRAEGAA